MQPQAYEPDLAQSLLVLADRLFDANDPAAAVEPILTAATLADRWHPSGPDLAGWPEAGGRRALASQKR